jgi:hypothetical protein
MTGLTTTTTAPSLQEMLADPIVQAVMIRDGVTKEDVTGVLATVRARMAVRQMEEHETGRHESTPIDFER